MSTRVVYIYQKVVTVVRSPIVLLLYGEMQLVPEVVQNILKVAGKVVAVYNVILHEAHLAVVECILKDAVVGHSRLLFTKLPVYVKLSLVARGEFVGARLVFLD